MPTSAATSGQASGDADLDDRTNPCPETDRSDDGAEHGGDVGRHVDADEGNDVGRSEHVGDSNDMGQSEHVDLRGADREDDETESPGRQDQEAGPSTPSSRPRPGSVSHARNAPANTQGGSTKDIELR